MIEGRCGFGLVVVGVLVFGVFGVFVDLGEFGLCVG